MTAARRILFVEKSFGLSGSTVSLATLLRHLDRQAFTAHVAVSRPEQRDFLLQQVEGISTIEVIAERASLANAGWNTRLLALARRHVPALRRPLLWSIGLFDLLFSTLPYALRLARLGRRHRVDLLHQNNGFELAALLAAAILRVPLVVFQRGDEPRTLIARLLAARVDQYVANSEATRVSLVSVRVPPGKIDVVYPPIDLTQFDPERPGRVRRADLGLQPAAPCFGIVGQLVEWKGHRVFLDAARRVLTAMPDACAVIVGDAPPDRGAYRVELEERAGRLGISDRVRFLGFREDVADLLRLMDVVVHASVFPEPFGRVLVEAMAMKKPVVASMAGGPVEVVENGRSGFLVPAGDDASMARRIVELLAAPEQARQMGEIGCKAASRFDVRIHMDKVHAIYARITPGRWVERDCGDSARRTARSRPGRRPC
jgi:glycosyltransferase involved in cell wall biosynthesis